METQDDAMSSDEAPSHIKWWPSDLMQKLKSVSLIPPNDSLIHGGSSNKHEIDGLAAQRAANTLWVTGLLAEPIPNGFYSIILERRLRDLFDTLPSLDELCALNLEGTRLAVILVDANKDKKLSLLKQLILTLVKGLYSNPAAVIKKIGGLVSEIYKRSNSELNHGRCLPDEVSYSSDCQGVQMLGHIRHGSCHSRAILFKVLADTVDINCKLMVGLPREGVMELTDSYRHMSVLVVLNSVEYLVDLNRIPGHLIPYSAKAIFRTHLCVTSEIDFAEIDSCDSPLEPNSPLNGFSDQLDLDGAENDESISSSYECKLEASLNAPGRSPQNLLLHSRTTIRGKINLSHSEPNVTNAFWRQSKNKIIAEQRTASSSPEHPSFRGHGRSILGGHGVSSKDYGNEIISRSVGASPLAARRRRRRSVSMIPEIGDDIVRAVRAMNETMKKTRLPKKHHDAATSSSTSENNGLYTQESVSHFHSDDQDEISGGKSALILLHRKQGSSLKAISLPSSPQHFGGQASERTDASEFIGSDAIISTWNKVLESSKTLNKPLLPFEEWNIDFSELNVGARVGIGFFGEVFRGMWNGMEVAIKVLLEQELTVENIEDFCNEISILSRLRHPNVILFLGACTKPPQLSMVTEYMEMGSLYYLIHVSGQKKRLSWRKRLKMLCDICRGLMYIHRMKTAHRDLKSANCLVNKHWMVKICDFGLSRVLTTTPLRDSSAAGTPEWMAPELIRNEPFTEKCDIFSLGVIIWELCTLNRPWEGVPSVQVVYAVANDGLRLEVPEGPLGKLITDCWAEPDDRPSCSEILARLQECEYIL